MLAQDGDLILAEHDDGAQTIGVALGAYTVVQAAAQAVSLRQGNVWFNLAAGVDYESLFYSARGSDSQLAPIRATAFRDALSAVPGVLGFDGAGQITFSRKGRTVTPSIPCLQIKCDDVRLSATIGVL